MLNSLSLRNLATINDTSIEFGIGLNILTGETGAGKSILIDGLLLVLGHRADTALVRPGAKTASVEAVFTLKDGSEFMIRREVRAKGRSRLFINDELATLDEGKDAVSGFVDLHSQNSTPALLRKRVQMAALDEFSGCSILSQDLGILFHEYRSLLSRFDELTAELDTSAEKRDIAQHELSLIEKLDPSADDHGSLLDERRELKAVQNGAEILTVILEGISGDNGILDTIGKFRHSLSGTGIEMKDTLELIEQADIALLEASSECEIMLSRIDSAPWRITEIDDRLDRYAELLGRCGGSLQNLLGLRGRLNEELARYEMLQEEYKNLKRIIPEKADMLHEKAIELSEARKQASRKLEDSARNELRLLGMPDADFRIIMTEPPENRSCTVRSKRICSDGCEIPEFIFSANPGIQPGPLSSVASGGEMSRVSLALKLVLASVTQAPTMIFDEIDSGVGGETANLLADSLSRVSHHRQVIVITHLPQIASRAHTHLAVSKDTLDGLPATKVNTLLIERERVEELARLLGGGEHALEHAKNMIRSDVDKGAEL